MSLNHVSLVRGWLPPTVAALAWASFVGGIAWRRRKLWHWLVLAALAGIAAVAIARHLDIASKVGSTYPRSFVAWGALPVFAFGAAILQWRRVGWIRRAVAALSVPALVAFGALQINEHYAYLPTFGDLVGARLPGQVSLRQLERGFAGGSGNQAGGPIDAATMRTGLVAAINPPATVSGFRHRSGFVWVPPVFFEHPRPHLPALLLISGTPGSPQDWLRGGGALAVANAWAAAHGGRAPIMVLADSNGSGFGDTECVDGPRGNAATYLGVDVRNYVHQRFGVPLNGGAWAIGGLSEGGTCALEMASLHPDRFQTFADFSGDPRPSLGTVARTVSELYGGSWLAFAQHNPAHWFRYDAAHGLQGVIAAGSDDHHYLSAEQRVVAVARADGLPVALDVVNGGHSFRVWRHAIADAFPWLVARLAATASSPAPRAGPVLPVHHRVASCAPRAWIVTPARACAAPSTTLTSST